MNITLKHRNSLPVDCITTAQLLTFVFVVNPKNATIRRWLSAFNTWPGLTQYSFTTITEQLKRSECQHIQAVHFAHGRNGNKAAS